MGFHSAEDFPVLCKQIFTGSQQFGGEPGGVDTALGVGGVFGNAVDAQMNGVVCIYFQFVSVVIGAFFLQPVADFLIISLIDHITSLPGGFLNYTSLCG